NALVDEMESDPRVMVLGLDVGKLGGVFRTTSGLIERFGERRVVDTPLAEASILGASLGLALSGMVPVAEIQFLGFTAQGFHQIGPQLAKYRHRSRGRFPCQVTIRAPFGGGIRSPELPSDAVDLRTLVPLDVETLVKAVAKTGRAVVVHEAPLSAGFGAEVVATLMEEAFYDLDAPVARVASYDIPFPAASMEHWYLPSLERVVAAARRTVSL